MIRRRKYRAVVLTSATATGPSWITWFDAALRNAGIAEYNLETVSSIVPSGTPAYVMKPGVPPILGDGEMMKCVYARAASDRPGEVQGAAVGISVSARKKKSGVIFFHQETGLTGLECAANVEADIKWAMTELRRNDEYRFACAQATSAGGDDTWHGALACLCFVTWRQWPKFKGLVVPA